MPYSDAFNLKTTNVTFNNVANAIDGLVNRTWGGTTAGTSTAYTAAPTQPWIEYTNGSIITVIPHTVSGVAATLNVSGLGARNIRSSNSNVVGSELPSGVPVTLIYDATHFQLLNHRGFQTFLSSISALDSISASNGSSVNMSVDGANSGTAHGSFFVAKSGGVSNSALGNWSAILGGVYNVATTLWSSNELRIITSGGGNERMRIDTPGHVLIGYTTSNGAYLLQVNSQIFATNATIATSDGRYKEDVTEVEDCLALVDALRPVSFRWKEHPVHNFTTQERDIGFIAQEIQEALKGTSYADAVVKGNETVLPDGTPETFLGLSEAKLIPLLVGAVQELKTKYEALELRLAALELLAIP